MASCLSHPSNKFERITINKINNYFGSTIAVLLNTMCSLYRQVVRINFVDFCTETCCDVVNICDGPSASSPSIGTLAGCTTPTRVFTTSQSSAFIRFTSDSSVVYRGFNFTYTSVPGDVFSYPASYCSGRFILVKGYIKMSIV